MVDLHSENPLKRCWNTDGMEYLPLTAVVFFSGPNNGKDLRLVEKFQEMSIEDLCSSLSRPGKEKASKANWWPLPNCLRFSHS